MTCLPHTNLCWDPWWVPIIYMALWGFFSGVARAATADLLARWRA